MSINPMELFAELEKLVGYPTSKDETKIATAVLHRASELLSSDLGLGFSQFNELMLQLGHDRVSHEFFQFLLDGTTEYTGGSIRSLEILRGGVDNFRKLALLRFGNVKFGFKTLSTNPTGLSENITRPIDSRKYSGRHKPALDIDPIDGNQTYYLGYLVKRKIKERLDAGDPHAEVEEQKRKSIVDQGIYNQDVYLCFDHMDVYIATSMREAHEYALVSKWTKEIFSSQTLSDLKIRAFDPTQAYCSDRIDKGLAEALMLKRAFCTVYFAQESDTLGKDSELASTLAQGKPVIAYIPVGGTKYAESLRDILRTISPEKDMRELLLQQLRLTQPSLAWEDVKVREWVNATQTASEADIFAKLAQVTEAQYENRARLLKDDHPLGIQVHLETGVANGVLVVRSLEDCARIIRRVLLNELEFEIEERDISGRKYILLIESISKSVFRVMTGDSKLTNSFWNFYLH